MVNELSYGMYLTIKHEEREMRARELSGVERDRISLLTQLGRCLRLGGNRKEVRSKSKTRMDTNSDLVPSFSV
uniref:Uncharacterized protein n=1 Tax=Arundo donax TaxID=35708 RepID=A0A0A9CJF2_ARUDO